MPPGWRCSWSYEYRAFYYFPCDSKGWPVAEAMWEKPLLDLEVKENRTLPYGWGCSWSRERKRFYYFRCDSKGWAIAHQHSIWEKPGYVPCSQPTSSQDRVLEDITGQSPAGFVLGDNTGRNPAGFVSSWRAQRRRAAAHKGEAKASVYDESEAKTTHKYKGEGKGVAARNQGEQQQRREIKESIISCEKSKRSDGADKGEAKASVYDKSEAQAKNVYNGEVNRAAARNQGDQLQQRGIKRSTAAATRHDQREEELSRALSKVLRHTAPKYGLPITKEGYIRLDMVLSFLNNHCSLNTTQSEVEKVVKNSPKDRFDMPRRNGVLHIRANNGHSIPGVADDLLLRRLSPVDNDVPEQIVHGTYKEYWDDIQKNGIIVGGRERNRRNHIHFSREEKAHMLRSNCDVWIYLKPSKLFGKGLELLLSQNGVILSRGNEKGCVSPDLFHQVWIKRETSCRRHSRRKDIWDIVLGDVD